jgi:diguanylate cyclase (GGDEF)-like protein
VNHKICGNKSSGSKCFLTVAFKILLIVVAVELAEYLFTAFAGKDNSVNGLVLGILRGLIVGIGIFFLFIVKKPDVVKDEAIEEEAPVVVVDNEPIQIPNIDALTRTSNETGLTISILELMALADRYGHKLSIGMIKVDGLDALEKTAADDAMINMAGLMTESLRLPDRIGRFRDNIFMVLLPESDLEGAAIVAGRLRESLQQSNNAVSTGQVSVWIGMTEFQRGEDMQSLFDRVEAAADQSRNEDNGVCIKLA